jgi:hypothetical protein
MAWFRVAAEGAGMMSREPSPPRWADAMLRSLLRPADRESISGDLLAILEQVVDRSPVLRRHSWGRCAATARMVLSANCRMSIDSLLVNQLSLGDQGGPNAFERHIPDLAERDQRTTTGTHRLTSPRLCLHCRH